MPDQIDIKVSEGLVRGILEAKVQAAIVGVLTKDSSIVEQVVSAALMTKVNGECTRSRYESDNRFTFLDALCRKTIRQAAEAAIQTWAKERQDVLEKEFLRQLQTRKTSSKLVRACIDGLAEATKNSWTFSVRFPE